jgi:hypothetical protein
VAAIRLREEEIKPLPKLDALIQNSLLLPRTTLAMIWKA